MGGGGGVLSDFPRHNIPGQLQDLQHAQVGPDLCNVAIVSKEIAKKKKLPQLCTHIGPPGPKSHRLNLKIKVSVARKRA